MTSTPKRDYGYINCVRCGEQIKRTGPSQKYCKPCWIEHRKETVGAAFVGMNPRPCKDCGTMIEHPKAPSHRYCDKCIKLREAEQNRKYADGWRRKHGCKVVGTPTVCEICGEEFPYSSGPQKYCNQCRQIYNQFQYKQNHQFQPYREITIFHDKRKCQVCGSMENLHVHHIDKRGIGHPHPNHNLDNLITLCRTCHAGVHWNKIECPVPIKTDEGWDKKWRKAMQQVG